MRDKELSKEEYEVLYFIWVGRNTFERMKGLFNIDFVLKTLHKLEGIGLVKISYRDGKLYGFMNTEKGFEVLESADYRDWHDECEGRN